MEQLVAGLARPRSAPQDAPATTIASARPWPPARLRPIARREHDVGGPEAAREQRKATPSESSAPPGVGESSTIPAPASAAQSRSRRAARRPKRDPERADELERHPDPERDPVESPGRSRVHPGERDPRTASTLAPLRAAQAAGSTARSRVSTIDREAEPHEDRPGRTELVEQRRGDRRADLDRDDRPEDERDRGGLAARVHAAPH